MSSAFSPFVPRIGEPLLGALEVVLDVALAADERAHLLAGRHRVDVVVLAMPWRAFSARMPSMKPGRVTRSCIVCGVVAVDARDRMRHELARLGVRHLVHRLEALDRDRRRRASCRHVDRRMAVHARAGLLRDVLPLGEGLVVEHVGVAALLAEVRRERVARPHGLQPRVFLEPRLRDDRARVGLRRRARHAPRCRRSACAPGRRCAGSRRTAAGSSCPRPPGRRSRRSARRRGRTGCAPPACARRC